MARSRATKSALDGFLKIYFTICMIVFADLALYGMFVTFGLIGAGFLVLGAVMLPLLVLFWPILVPLGIFVSSVVTLQTLVALTAMEIYEEGN